MPPRAHGSPPSRILRLLLLVALPAGAALTPYYASAQGTDPAARFTVTDVMVPARDGVRLHTKIFTPKDAERPAALHHEADALRHRRLGRQLRCVPEGPRR